MDFTDECPTLLFQWVWPPGRVDVGCFMSRLALALAHPSPSVSPDDEKQKRCVLHPTLVGTKRNSAMLSGVCGLCVVLFHLLCDWYLVCACHAHSQ